MGRKEKIAVGDEKTIKHTGYFNYENLYYDLRHKFGDEHYYDMSEDYTEKSYAEDGTLTQKVVFRAEFEYSDYIRNMIKYKLELKGKPEVVDLDGVPTKMMKGTVTLKMISWIHPNWFDKRHSYPFMSFLHLLQERLLKKSKFINCKKKTMQDRKLLEELFQRNMYGAVV